MAIRLRYVDTGNGDVLVAVCAARTVEKPGDVYIDDNGHHALTAKFAEDFNGEGLWPIHQDEIMDQLREDQESNNPAREWWDSTYAK